MEALGFVLLVLRHRKSRKLFSDLDWARICGSISNIGTLPNIFNRAAAEAAHVALGEDAFFGQVFPKQREKFYKIVLAMADEVESQCVAGKLDIAELKRILEQIAGLFSQPKQIRDV